MLRYYNNSHQRSPKGYLHVCFFHIVKLYTAKIRQGVLTQSKSLFELIKSVIVTFPIISAVFTFSAKLLICSQTLINLKQIQKLEILYEFDVRFHTKLRSPICHVLLAVQNTHRRALLFIDNRQFIGFLHKQN